MANNNTLGAMTKRVLAVYDSASETAQYDGSWWYPNALAFVTAASRVHSVPTENVTAALSHLSPRVHWVRNKRMLIELLETGDTKGLRSNIERAKAALAADEPLATINGPKTQAFALNILGDPYPVTVDVHAAYIALGEYPTKSLKGKLYSDIAKAYRNAAKLRDIEPATIQAITWCAWRGKSH